MDKQIFDLQQKLKTLRNFIAFLTVGLILSFLFNVMLYLGSQPQDIITAKGIILLDDQGRERVLLGAPIPLTKNRVRTDDARVNEIWGKDMPEEFPNWYKDYNHDCYGMLVLDKNGFDRLALGSPTPDPYFGKRIGPSTGVIINDETGLERSGYGLMPVGEGNRIVLGLDSEYGTEGATFSIFEDGTTGLSVYNNDRKESLFIGNSKKDNPITPSKNDYFNIVFKDSLGQTKFLNDTE